MIDEPDDILLDLQRELDRKPSPEFAARVRLRLDRESVRTSWRWRPAVALALGAAAVMGVTFGWTVVRLSRGASGAAIGAAAPAAKQTARAAESSGKRTADEAPGAADGVGRARPGIGERAESVAAAVARVSARKPGQPRTALVIPDDEIARYRRYFARLASSPGGSGVPQPAPDVAADVAVAPLPNPDPVIVEPLAIGLIVIEPLASSGD